MNRSSILLFLSLALIGCRHTTNAPLSGFAGYVGSRARKSETKIRNCQKIVTVFMEESAGNNFKRIKTDIRYVLEIVNLNFASQGIDIRYDLKSLRIKKWAYPGLPSGKDLEETKDNLLRLADGESSAGSDDSDVKIFVTSIMTAGEGRASMIGWKFWRFGNRGKGSMLIGNYMSFNDGMDNISSNERDSYLATMAATIAHEQGHLYGLNHVSDSRSLMHDRTVYGKIRFLDEYSKKRLQDILSIERKCAAP